MGIMMVERMCYSIAPMGYFQVSFAGKPMIMWDYSFCEDMMGWEGYYNTSFYVNGVLLPSTLEECILVIKVKFSIRTSYFVKYNKDSIRWIVGYVCLRSKSKPMFSIECRCRRINNCDNIFLVTSKDGKLHTNT